MEVAVARLDRMCRIAEDEGVTILLENMNPEPADAEVKYLVHDVEEAKFYFANLTSPILRWAFTSNHAHMRPRLWVSPFSPSSRAIRAEGSWSTPRFRSRTRRRP